MKVIKFYIKKYYVAVLAILFSVFDVFSKLEEYIPNIHLYIFVYLVIFQIINLVKASKAKLERRLEKNSIYITTNNDYARQASSFIFSVILVGVSIYFLIYSTYFDHLNVSLFLIFSVLLFFRAFYLDRSLKINVKNNNLFYKLDKDEKSFEINDLLRINITNNDIIFIDKIQSKSELTFLEITNKDIEELIRFLRVKIKSDIEISFNK